MFLLWLDPLPTLPGQAAEAPLLQEQSYLSFELLAGGDTTSHSLSYE